MKPDDKPLRGVRKRTTRFGVRLQERVSTLLITVGGIGTIGAVTLIFAFLVFVAAPLFRGAALVDSGSIDVSGKLAEAQPIHLAVDEYGNLASALYEDGTVRIIDLERGTRLAELRPFAAPEQGAGPGPPTAWSISPIGESLAFGFDDGSIRLATFGYRTTFPREDQIPAELLELGPADSTPHEGGILQRTPEGAFRLQRFELSLGEPMPIEGGGAILRLAHIADDGDDVFCAWMDDGRLVTIETEEEMDLLTGETRYGLEVQELAYRADPERGVPEYLHLSGIGASVLLIWKDGRMERLDVRDPDETTLTEVVDLTPEEGATLTATGFLIGHSTLITGASNGAIRAWFGTKPADADTTDGTVFVMAHELVASGPAVTTLAPSPRSRMVAAGLVDGTLRLIYVTTNRTLATTRLEAGEPVLAARFLPKEDALIALGRRVATRWALDARHPAASWRSLFGPVWYEGYPRPEHVWQSEGATDEFESKLGFMPLIFGTLKASFYTMLFGAPLALLAAIFTSEFLERRLRVPVKSTIEMMASLPSVVLGFLAGIVIAPFAQKILPATLAVFATLPFAFLLGAYLWQLLPQRMALRWSGLPRLVSIAIALPVGIAAALVAGPWLEQVFFAGDMELWLDGQIGNAVGGWMLILLPLSAFLAILVGGRLFSDWMRSRSAGWSRTRCALADIAKFGGGTALTVLIALGISWSLDRLGFDPRGSYVDTYVQRNALVVGFVMGFAVIPIIYTLAEDALSSVPEHLRQASLGSGATQWQTAMRIIVPTAMSGLFSAVMIGFGRAIGETMIVLMATGNTPLMEANIFNGFRTLSANIAVELPEAVQNSTHYRTLFLAALVLFAMTFVLNTLAESVRSRFRRRAFQL